MLRQQERRRRIVVVVDLSALVEASANGWQGSSALHPNSEGQRQANPTMDSTSIDYTVALFSCKLYKERVLGVC